MTVTTEGWNSSCKQLKNAELVRKVVHKKRTIGQKLTEVQVLKGTSMQLKLWVDKIPEISRKMAGRQRINIQGKGYLRKR